MIDEQQNKSKSKINGESVGSIQARQGECCSSPIGSPASFMYRGYFPLWRKIRDWGWYKDSNTKSVFLELLLLCNHKKTHYLGYTILPGQCVTGRKKLSIDLGISEQTIRTCIRRLKSTNEITIENCNKFSIITLNNYNKYTQSTNDLTINQPATNQQLTTPNNDNNYKNEKKIVESNFPHLNNKVFKETWGSWLDVRKKLKVPNTPKALDLALKKLNNVPVEEAILMLEQSIERGWRGIFPLKNQSSNYNNTNHTGRIIPKEETKPLVRPTYTKEEEEERIKVMADLKSKLKI